MIGSGEDVDQCFIMAKRDNLELEIREVGQIPGQRESEIKQTFVVRRKIYRVVASQEFDFL